MAVAAPSPLASSVEKTNGAKLSRLLIDGGTTVLRKVFDGIHPSANLASDLTSCYSILNNLLRRRILNDHQWDKLFPTGGAAPDSHSFDITLLFILLTNICGLFPPPSGWYTKPPPSDTSLEANLARIKFFRNVLYGHVSSIGVDTPTFSTMWQEISLPLIALGMDQAEINRLKAENGGEEDYLDALFEWADSEKDIKSQLKNVQQTQTKTQQTVQLVRQTQSRTQQTVEDVRQTQIEDHEILQNSKSKLEEMCQTQTKIQQTVEQVRQDCTSKLNEVHQDLQQVKKSLDTSRERKEKDRTDKVLRNLAKAEFKGDIEYHVQRFQADTREWVFNRVQNWLDDRSSPSRVMVITGNAGMGKSVIAAVICQRMQKAGRLSGNHFSQHDNARYRNPQLMLQSLACQLSHALPEYKQALVKQLSRNLGTNFNGMGVKELFALLFKEPLSALGDPGSNMLMVIDGLDESEYEGRNELLDLIANQFCKLPSWIRFLVTTRPATNITEKLKHLKPFQLEPEDEKNAQDIRTVIQKRIQYIIKPNDVETVAQNLVLKCEGLMLYAHFVTLAIEGNPSVLEKEDFADSLPWGISSVYHSYFKRLEGELLREVNVNEENFLNLLSAITASREPLPIDFVSKLLIPGEHSSLAKRRILKALGTVSSLLPIRDGCLHFIHKSVKDWLTDSSCYGKHDFVMEKKQGHRVLARLCATELDDLKRKSVHNVQYSATEKYALFHGARHMFYEETRRDRLEELTNGYITDLGLMYAKLCVSSSLAAEDIVWLRKQGISTVLREDVQTELKILLFLLRKYHVRLTSHPYLLLQCVLNEGGAVLSGEASNLLQTKYPEIPYMECVHKESQQGRVLCRFECSACSVCIDVSPKLDLMVCECMNGMLQLWSLQTGRLLWERKVQVPKRFMAKGFRELPCSPRLSFYRSVVFHPTKDLVLPGILSHAYTIDGDLKPLFVESSCRFSVCSVSGDKSKILTDCLGDAKCLLLWSLEDGAEVARITRDEDVLSFAWSHDGTLLAISLSTGSICLLDVTSDFTILAQTTLPEVCAMLKFSPDSRVFYCLCAVSFKQRLFRVNVSVRKNGRFSLDLSSVEGSYGLKRSESLSDCGFPLGDPISSSFERNWIEGEFCFVLGRHILLIGSLFDRTIEMLSTIGVAKNTKGPVSTAEHIALSLDGEIVYVVSGGYEESALVAWDVSSGKLIAENNTGITRNTCPVTVRAGVLLQTGEGTLKLWRVDLSKCIRRWTNLSRIIEVVPISEERVACITRGEVYFLDRTSGDILSTFPFDPFGYVIACDCKGRLITRVGDGLFRLSDGISVFWEKIFPFDAVSLPPLVVFSPTEQFFMVCQRFDVFIIELISGDILQTFHGHPGNFISDEECVVCHFSSVRLYNVKSGDLLSVIDTNSCVSCLAVCPSKRLFAIGFRNSNSNYKVLRVWLPGDKDNRKSRRMDNTVQTGQIKEARRAGKQQKDSQHGGNCANKES